MMSNYVVCEEPEHDQFGHRKEDCTECNPVAVKMVTEAIGRRELIALLESALEENSKLQSRLTELASGLTIKGWWCVCNMFNGCEKEERFECRSCGLPKTERL